MRGPVATAAQMAFVVRCEQGGFRVEREEDEAFPAAVYRLRVTGPEGSPWVNVLWDGSWCSVRVPGWAKDLFGQAYLAAKPHAKRGTS